MTGGERRESSPRRLVRCMWLAMAFVAGCVVPPPAGQPMLIMASAMTKLAAAVEAEVRFGDVPEEIAEADLLVRSTAHDPELLAPFAGYRIRVRRLGSFSSVLMCSGDGSTALLEDAGCTARFDGHLWQQSPSLPCTFQLDLPKVCAPDR